MPRNRKPSSPPKQQNRLRVIGGRWRGRKLGFPDLSGLRPTPDRVRETLFNWLGQELTGARCLDLFGGSGALSFEALSRGAEFATLIDQSDKVIRQLRQNLGLLSCENFELIRADALQWLSELTPGQRVPYDIIFLDPPFHQGLVEPCCQLLQRKLLLKETTCIYIETEKDWSGKEALPWVLHRSKTAGQVNSHLFIANESSRIV